MLLILYCPSAQAPPSAQLLCQAAHTSALIIICSYILLHTSSNQLPAAPQLSAHHIIISHASILSITSMPTPSPHRLKNLSTNHPLTLRPATIVYNKRPCSQPLNSALTCSKRPALQPNKSSSAHTTEFNPQDHRKSVLKTTENQSSRPPKSEHKTTEIKSSRPPKSELKTTENQSSRP